MNYLKLTKEKLDVSAINELVADSSCGAISMFVGTTRDNFEKKKVLCLEYEAYEPMALKAINKICADIRSKWPDIKHIAVYHRLGTVPVKEASIVIAISSPHRQTSLHSVDYTIDELKRTVPIWKKEQYDDNAGGSWKENKECPQSRHSKRPKLDFDTCTLEKACIPQTLVQIAADENEVFRRIQCFIEKKREEIDTNNVLDFINKKPENDNQEDTCARVNSIFIKQKDSNGHLKVQRVKNEIGPQTRTEYTSALDKLMIGTPSTAMNSRIKQEPGEPNRNSLSIGVAERIENAEKYLNINGNDSRHIYERIKAIEDRILFLETVSPEYHHFLNPKASNAKKIFKKTYTVKDLDDYIKKIEVNISKSVVRT